MGGSGGVVGEDGAEIWFVDRCLVSCDDWTTRVVLQKRETTGGLYDAGGVWAGRIAGVVVRCEG